MPLGFCSINTTLVVTFAQCLNKLEFIIINELLGGNIAKSHAFKQGGHACLVGGCSQWHGCICFKRPLVSTDKESSQLYDVDMI